MILCVATCAFVLLAVFVEKERDDRTLPRSASAPVSWVKSEYIGAPNNEPIIGFWIVDGDPVPATVIEAGGQYYQYSDVPGAPACLLFGYPPLYWSYMPNAAR